MEQDVSDFVLSLFRSNAIERLSQAEEFIAKRSDPKTLILDALAEFGVQLGEVPEELRTKYISKHLTWQDAADNMNKKVSPRAKLQERRAKTEARINKKKGNSVLQRQLSRRELKAATERNTQANQQIASLYQRDSTRKKRKSRMIKRANSKTNATSPKKVMIEATEDTPALGKLHRQPSDGLPEEFSKFMKSNPSSTKQTKDEKSNEPKVKARGISFDLDDDSENTAGIPITRRVWSEDEIKTRTRQVHQYDLLGFKVRKLDGLLVVCKMNKAGCHFRGWLKPGDVILSINDVENMDPKAVNRMIGPMGAIIKKVDGVFPGIENHDIENDTFAVTLERKVKNVSHEEEAATIENEKENSTSEKENESEKEPESTKSANITVTKSNDNLSEQIQKRDSTVQLLTVDTGSKSLGVERQSIASPFSDTSEFSETDATSEFFSKASSDGSNHSRKKKKKKRRRKRSKESDERQARRLQKMKEYFANLRRQDEDLSDDILEAQVSQDIRNRILETLKAKLERNTSAKGANEVAWKRMEDILELQIDEVMHGNKSDLTTTTSRDLVYNAIKLIFKELDLPKEVDTPKRVSKEPKAAGAKDPSVSEPNRGSYIANDAVINELTILISESKATIATLESLGVSTPEINRRLFVERENLQNLTNQLLASLPTTQATRARLSSVGMDPAPPVQQSYNIAPSHGSHLVPAQTGALAWSFSENDLSRYTEDIPDDPEVMRQEIQRLRTQMLVKSVPVPFAHMQPQPQSQKQTLRTIGRTRSSSYQISKPHVSVSPPMGLQQPPPRRVRAFSSDLSDPSVVVRPPHATPVVQGRARAFSSDHHNDPMFRIRQLNPEEMISSTPLTSSQPNIVQPHNTLNPPQTIATANPPIPRTYTGSSSSSDNPSQHENDSGKKGSMAERAAAASLSSPGRRTLMRVPSMTRIGGKTEKLNAKFTPQSNSAMTNVLSSSNPILNDREIFPSSVHIKDENVDSRLHPFSLGNISSATSPLHALAADRSFEIHE